MKKQIVLMILSMLFCFGAFSQREYYEISLNGQWAFRIDSADIGEKEHWYDPETGVNFLDMQTVPGNWNLRNKYAAYTGKAWYKKRFFIGKDLKGKLIRLYFEGVYNDAKVWVNGKFAIANDLGYLAFEKDISALLNYGGENTIVVCVDNSFKIGALWNWGGIRRPVKLLVNDKVYIVQNHITPKVNLQNGTADVGFELRLSNKNDYALAVNGNIDLFQKDKLIKSIPFKTTIAAGKEQKLLIKTHLGQDDVKLWSFDEPNLYTCRLTLIKGKDTIDRENDNFGLRSIVLDNDTHQLKLNGEVIRAIGFDLVPDDRTTGNTLPLWRVKEDIDLMKSLGIRIARLSHVPFHKELLDYLDEKGILIFEEIPVWGYSNLVKSNHEKTDNWLRRMINDHYNHPCIAGWSVGNEIGKNKAVMEYVKGSIRLVKQLDSTRMGVMISHTAYRPVDPVSLSDIGFVNAYGKDIGKIVEVDHQMHPASTLFLSEFGMGQLHEDLSSDIPIKMLMDSIRSKPYLIGASLWTFNDYRSTYKDTKEYSQNRPWGLVDVFRQKKKAFYSFQCANKPVAEMSVTHVEIDDNSYLFRADLSIKPRDISDIPSYKLQNYRVVLKLFDSSDKLVGGAFHQLPEVSPGDKVFQLLLDSKLKNKQLYKADISLVSPLNYSVYDTILYFEKPLKTQVIDAITGFDETDDSADPKYVLRVQYEPNQSATSFRLRYIADSITRETTPTNNNYITVSDIKPGQEIHAELIGSNEAGETITAIPDIKVSDDILAPLVTYTEPEDGSFFTGFKTWKDERELAIEITDKKGDFSRAKKSIAIVKGVVDMDSLKNGKTYFYRIKRNVPDSTACLWSNEIEVKPDRGLPPEKPFIQGIIANDRSAIICFHPVKKSIGYNLLFRSDDEKTWHHKMINASQINQYLFKIPQSFKKIQIRLATINQYGTSEYAASSFPAR